MIMNKNPIRLRESTVEAFIKIKALNKKKTNQTDYFDLQACNM